MKRIEVGQLGEFDLVPGFYAQVGSAFGTGRLQSLHRGDRLGYSACVWQAGPVLLPEPRWVHLCVEDAVSCPKAADPLAFVIKDFMERRRWFRGVFRRFLYVSFRRINTGKNILRQRFLSIGKPRISMGPR